VCVDSGDRNGVHKRSLAAPENDPDNNNDEDDQHRIRFSGNNNNNPSMNIPIFNPISNTQIPPSTAWIKSRRLNSTNEYCLNGFGQLVERCTGKTIARSFERPGKHSITLTYRMKTVQRRVGGKIVVVGREIRSFSFEVDVVSGGGGGDDSGSGRRYERKEFRQLSKSEWTSFVDALYILKKFGIYDILVAGTYYNFNAFCQD
jgi:hypothetical protein